MISGTAPCPDLTTISSPQAAKVVCTYSEDVGYRRGILKHKNSCFLRPSIRCCLDPCIISSKTSTTKREDSPGQLHVCMDAGAVAEHTAEILLGHCYMISLNRWWNCEIRVSFLKTSLHGPKLVWVTIRGSRDLLNERRAQGSITRNCDRGYAKSFVRT